MAQAGAAYYYTASVQPMKSRNPKASGGSKHNARPTAAPNRTESRKLNGKESGSAGKKINMKSGVRPESGSAQRTQQNPYGKPVYKSAGTSRMGSGYPGNSAKNPAAKRKTAGKQNASGKRSSSAAAPRKHITPQMAQKRREEERRRRILEMRRRERINRVMLGITGGLIVAALFVYISRMAELAALSKQADMLRMEITKIEEERQYKEVELAESRNPIRIKDAALGRLGMIEPSPEQIRYISISADE